MKTNRKMPAVIRAPRDAGDNIPNMAKTAKIDVHYEAQETNSEYTSNKRMYNI